MAVCGICTGTINRRDSYVFCSVCKKQFHSACITKSVEFLELLNKINGLSWKCDDCTHTSVSVNTSELSKLIEDKILIAIASLNATVECLKADIALITANKICNCGDSKVPDKIPKYSEIVKNKTNPAVIIQPKNHGQEYSRTKSELLQKINPVNSNLQFSKVVNVNNGGILVSCGNKDENDKFKKMVEENLSESYVVREVNGINPRVRIVGITEKYSEENLLDCVFKCNTGLFSDKSLCNLIKLWPTKKNKDIFQAVLQLDKGTYEKVSRAGNLFVNYDSCVVFDAVEAYRCYNCNEFHHSSKTCKNAVSCPRCGHNHEIKHCKSNTLTCSNCVKLNVNQNVKVNTDHAAWDTKSCIAYKRTCERIRNDLLAGQCQ